MDIVTYTIRVPADLDYAIGAMRAAKAAGVGLPEPMTRVDYDNQQFLEDFVVANARIWDRRLVLRTGRIGDVPLSVPATSAIIILARRGLKAQVEAAIAGIADAATKAEMQTWYQRAASFERYSRPVLGMQRTLQAADPRWTDAFMDDLWRAADALDQDVSTVPAPAPAPVPAPTPAPAP